MPALTRLASPIQTIFAAIVPVLVVTVGTLTAAFSPPASALTKAEVKVAFTQNTASEFVASVTFGKQQYRFPTYVPDFENPNVGIDQQRALSGWKGDYLFVRHQCGQAANWRCVVDQVFTLKSGSLLHLGAVESRDCTVLGCRYDDATGEFRDVLDRFQVNPVTGQTDSPPVPIVRRVVGGALVTDRDATWALNKRSYDSAIACLQHMAANGFEVPCAEKQNPWTAFLSAAKLTRVAGRTAEWNRLFDEHAKAYCGKSADARCTWRLNGTQDFLAKIEAGEVPTSTPTPVRLVRADVDDKKDMVGKIAPSQPIKLKL
jgi:hypothetical protein